MTLPPHPPPIIRHPFFCVNLHLLPGRVPVGPEGESPPAPRCHKLHTHSVLVRHAFAHVQKVMLVPSKKTITFAWNYE